MCKLSRGDWPREYCKQDNFKTKKTEQNYKQEK